MSSPDVRADNQFMRLLEQSVQHWIERTVKEIVNEYHERFDSIFNSDNVISVGGLLAIQRYLVGESRLEFSTRGLVSHITFFCVSPEACEVVAKGMSDRLNELANEFGEGRPHSAWSMLCTTLMRYLSVNLGKTPADFSKLALFKAAVLRINKVKQWTVAVRLKDRGFASDLAVVSLLPASDRLKRAVKQNKSDNVAALVDYPQMNGVFLKPLNLIMEEDKPSVALSLLIIKALLKGHVNFRGSNGGDSKRRNVEKAYDYALRSAAAYLKKHKDLTDSSQLRAALTGDGLTPPHELLAHKAGGPLAAVLAARADAYHDTIVHTVIDAAVRSKRSGRYSDMRLQLDGFLHSKEPVPNSRSGLSIHQMVHLYTIQSSVLNVTCLLASILGRPSLLSNARFVRRSSSVFNTDDAIDRLPEVSFKDYMHDMDVLFGMRIAPTPAIENVKYKDLVVFRTVDLFELPRQNVYQRKLPFDIVNFTLISTSCVLETAINFLKHRSACCILRITVDSNYTRMLAIKNVSEFPNEEEVIFPRGSVFEVRKRSFVIYRNDSIMLLDATVRWDPALLKRPFDHLTQDGGGGGGRRSFVDLSGVTDRFGAVSGAIAAQVAKIRRKKERTLQSPATQFRNT
jgi:hypothetical protein